MRARIATQIVISQAITLLWLLVVVCGGLALLGVAFSTVSAQPNSAAMDLYHPVDVVTSSRTIRYDRRPRRPSVVAIATGVIVAILVLAVVWVQMSFSSAQVASDNSRRRWGIPQPGLGARMTINPTAPTPCRGVARTKIWSHGPRVVGRNSEAGRYQLDRL